MKQTERKTGCVVNKWRRGSALGRGTKRSSPPAQWPRLKWPETPALLGTSVLSLPAATRAGRIGRNFAAGCCPSAGSRLGFGAEAERCPEPGDSAAGMSPEHLLLPGRDTQPLNIQGPYSRGCLSALTSATLLVLAGSFYLPARCCNSARKAESFSVTFSH